MGERTGRPPKCGGCGECERCARAAYVRGWYAGRTPEQKRAAVKARDPKSVREQDRRKQARRRREGTAEQKLKIAARAAVRLAIGRGALTRQPCEREGCEKPGQAHHDDYTRPLDVRWLCRAHHQEEHE